MRKRNILLLSFCIVIIPFALALVIPLVFKEQVSALLRRKMNEHVRANVSFTSAEVNLWRHFPQFTLTLEDFTVSGKQQFPGDTLVSTAQLHIVLGTFNLLLENNVEIRELTFEKPTFHIIRSPNGYTNYDIFSGTPEKTTDSTDTHQLRLNIESCTIANGKFLYEDLAIGLLMKGDAVELEGLADIDENIYELSIAAGVNNFSTVLDKKTHIANKDIAFDLQASYDIRDNSFRFKDNSIHINHLEFDAAGLYMPVNKGYYVDVKFHSENADFHDLLSISDDLFKNNFEGMNVKGHANIEGFVKGIYRPGKKVFPGFKVNMKVADGFIKYDELPSSVNDIHLDMVAENSDSVLENTIIHVKTFNMNLGRNPFKGDFMIDGFRDGKIKMDIASNIRLEDLQKVYPMKGILIDGDLQFDLKADGKFSGYIDEIQIREFKKIPAFNFYVSIRNGTLKYDHLPEAITNLQFEVKGANSTGVLDQTSVRIEQLQAKLGDNPVRGFIHLDGLRHPVINSEILAQVDLSEIRKFYPLDSLELNGQFELDMKINGQLNDSLRKFPLVDMRIAMENGSVESAGYPYPMNNTHLVIEAVNETGKLKDTRIHIDTLTYAIEDESFFIEGTISDLEKYNYDLTVKGILYLDKLTKIFKASADTEMSGEVDLDFRTTGNYEDLRKKLYHRIPTSGQIGFKNIQLKNSMIPQRLVIDAGHLFFTNEKIFLDSLRGTFGSSNFNVTGHLYNYMAYLLHSEETIKGDMLFESSSFTINELLTEGDVTDTEYELTAFKVPENIDFTFDANIEKLLYKELSADRFKGEVILKDGVLTVSEGTFNTLNANFDITGDYDSRDIAHPLFDISVKIDELDINKAHDAFVTVQAIAPAAEDTYGIFSLDYAIRGELFHNLHPVFETLQGGGTVRIREARVNGMKVFHHISGITKKEELMNPELKDLVMETTVENGMMYVKPFSMKLAGFDTDIEGKHSIDGTLNYVLRMAIPPFDIVKIPLHINGTYDNPKIHLGKGHEEVFRKITMVNKE